MLCKVPRSFVMVFISGAFPGSLTMTFIFSAMICLTFLL
nr:MAG TPA: hypothetical protein [Caudoviricetes sp.]